MNYAQQLVKPLGNTFERYVAFLDVLGFSNFVLNNDHYLVVQEYSCVIRSLIDLALAEVFHQITGAPILSNDGGPNLQNVAMECITSSDSIFFLTPQNTKKDFIILTALVSRLMVRLLYEGFPVRGAITQGSITYNKDVSNNSNVNHLLFLGRPIVGAVNLEKEQNWSVCVVHPDIIEKLTPYLSDLTHVISYPDPQKASKVMHVINWPQGVAEADVDKIAQEKIKESFNKYRKNETSTNKVNEMIANTIQFFEYSKSSAICNV